MLEMTVSGQTELSFGDFLYLGDYRRDVEAMLHDAFAQQSMPGEPVARSPRRIVQALIDDPARESIGGDQQLAIANQSGFQPYRVLRPRVQGQPQACMTYLGTELTPENWSVGAAIVGAPGMV